MKGFSEKLYIRLSMPEQESFISDQKRIQHELAVLGYEPVTFPLHIIQKLYPMCRKADFNITISLVHREADWVIADVEPGDQTQKHYGLAVDYGSTTIIMQLIDMDSGKVIDHVQSVNGQALYGADILSRITYSMEQNSNKCMLHTATVETFNRLLSELEYSTGIAASKCPMMVISGNAAMIHFLLKLDAWPVFAAPYAPVATDPGFLWGSELGIGFEGLIYIIPSASNYIGGDIVSGLLALEIHKKAETSLFFDIGTNGELVIGNQDWIIAGAGAAGPALEGYISRFGMRAAAGAVDSVSIRGNNLTCTAIGSQLPRGICGSGILDLLAQMRLSNWINIAGELNPQASERIMYLEEEQQYAVIYALSHESASGEPLYFTQTDIRQYLDTKAAACTMVECLMDAAGISTDDLAHLYLSGAFAAHSDLESAITVGMIPDLPRNKFTVLSNSSLDGARALLLNRSRIQEVQKLSSEIYCIQLASIPNFLIRMQAAKFIPHTDMSRFPSVSALLPR